MKKYSDTTKREIYLLLEPYEISNFIREYLKKEGYFFEDKEIELKFDFVEAGSPSYKTGQIKCSIKITKDLTPQTD